MVVVLFLNLIASQTSPFDKTTFSPAPGESSMALRMEMLAPTDVGLTPRMRGTVYQAIILYVDGKRAKSFDCQEMMKCLEISHRLWLDT